MLDKRFLCLIYIVLLLTQCAVYIDNDDAFNEQYDAYERCINDKNSTDDNSENCCILINDKLDKSYCFFSLKKKKHKFTVKLHSSKHKNHFSSWHNRGYGLGWHRRTGKFSFINRYRLNSRYNQKYSWTWRRRIGNIYHHIYMNQKRYKQHRKNHSRLSHRASHRWRH